MQSCSPLQPPCFTKKIVQGCQKILDTFHFPPHFKNVCTPLIDMLSRTLQNLELFEMVFLQASLTSKAEYIPDNKLMVLHGTGNYNILDRFYCCANYNCPLKVKRYFIHSYVCPSVTPRQKLEFPRYYSRQIN